MVFQGFNGAALWKARKDQPASTTQNASRMLQWGRALESAEGAPL